jgi:Ca2+-binding EF-hand superfamily protein
MGLGGSRDQRGDVSKEEIALVVQQTSWDEADVREYHAAFRAQYPTGLIDRETFIRENLQINGGTAELWAHVYRLVGRVHPLATNTSKGFSLAAATAFDDEVGAAPRHGSSAVHNAARSPEEEDEDDDMGRGENDDADNNSGSGGGDGDTPAEDEDDSDTEMTTLHGAERRQPPRHRAPGSRGGGLPHDDLARQTKLRTSYVASADAEDSGFGVSGMTFSHVMIRLHRAQFSPVEKKIKYLFALMDTDNDGLVNVADVTRLLCWMFELHAVQRLAAYEQLPQEEREDPGRRARALIMLLDRDNDSLLTQDEFLESCRMDTSLLDMLAAAKV